MEQKSITDGWEIKVVPRERGEAWDGSWTSLTERSLPATVPGDWILDYVRAGLFPDPYFGDNFVKLYPYERYHVFYRTVFYAERGGDEETFLLFDGIDTIADIYLNGKKIGHTENMFVEHQIKASGTRKGENELIVHLLPVVTEAEKIKDPSAKAFKYNVPALYFRKATHTFGWDICPRIVGGGIWKEVFLVRKNKQRIENVFLRTREIKRNATLSLRYAVQAGEDCEIAVEGRCGESTFSAREKVTSDCGEMEIMVSSPKLWWVRGYGQPDLYDVTVTLICKGEVADEKVFRYGIRTVELIAGSVTTKEKRGRFDFFINGKMIYIKGTNWVPCDAFHSRDKERMPAILDLVWDCGCNALRVWGGGVYESDYFYDWCDERGIFVWQDFMMACAIYPQTDRMKSQLSDEVRKVTRRLRNHPSLCLWAGDNECDVAYRKWFGGGLDPADNRLTREVIPGVLRTEDGSRPYLPSSPYLSPEAVKNGLSAPEQHLWGPRKYFKGKFYRNNTATFVSEIGYHGCPSVRSIKRFIPEEKLWNYKGNAMWLYHASSPDLFDSPYTYRIGLMARQIGYFFGYKPRSLERFSEMSQITQAEAKKYFIESFRCRMGERSGLIWWNLIDCWPQFSDAVVDYYFCKKLAYRYITVSQQPLCLMMDKFNGKLTLFAVSDLDEDREIEYTVTVSGREVAKGKGVARAHRSIALCSMKGRGRKFFVIRWKTPEGEGKNHFLLGRPLFAEKWYKEQMRIFGEK